VLIIEDHATQGGEYVDADDLRRRSEESIQG
jgi:hypothetical protein